MEEISFHGNKIGLMLFFVMALSVCSAVGTYRLKKTAELKHWEKALAAYSVELENENNAVVKGNVILYAMEDK